MPVVSGHAFTHSEISVVASCQAIQLPLSLFSLQVLQVLQRPNPADGADSVRVQHHPYPQRRQEEEARTEDRPPGGGRSCAGCAEQRAG